MTSNNETKAKDDSRNAPRRDNKPDHGQNFVPGSESAPSNLAPQPLDHFKRGYKERAELRDREMSHVDDLDSDRSQAARDNAPKSDKYYGRSLHLAHDRPLRPRPAKEMRAVGVKPRDNLPMGFDVKELVSRLSTPGCALKDELNYARNISPISFETGKAITAILSHLARVRKLGVALSVWQWMDDTGIQRNVFHFNSLISVCEKMKDWRRALDLLEQMEKEGVKKNEVTFSSAISACEKSGNYQMAIKLLDRMSSEGIYRTAIAYNAAISACEKGLNPGKAMEIFERMKREGVDPTVITYSALISACEKGGQWKLALQVLEEMKYAGFGANVIAYSAAISALSRGQQWEKALELFREIEESGGTPSVVTYNATMTALEKGLQWERALDLFDEMKYKQLPITVVSFGSAIAACEKGYQWRQCLDFLDEMTERGIKKNVIIFGAAMSCMEKSCRADIAFQLMDRMKIEGVSPNVHIYNSAISACARCNMWEKGHELFIEMDRVGVVRDVVTYNAVLDAVCPNVPLARKLFQEGVKKGFYARVSRLGTQWLELDLHFLSLGGGEIALGWWFEECLVAYLVNSSKLAAVKSIDIVTGYGKTRMRGARHGDDGMRKRVRAMLKFMNVKEIEQPNKGRVHIDKEELMKEVKKNNGKIIFDAEGYRKFREQETTANAMPDVVQVRRPRAGAPRSDENFGRRDPNRNDRHNGHSHGSSHGMKYDHSYSSKDYGRDGKDRDSYRRDDRRDRHGSDRFNRHDDHDRRRGHDDYRNNNDRHRDRDDYYNDHDRHRHQRSDDRHNGSDRRRLHEDHSKYGDRRHSEEERGHRIVERNSQNTRRDDRNHYHNEGDVRNERAEEVQGSRKRQMRSRSSSPARMSSDVAGDRNWNRDEISRRSRRSPSPTNGRHGGGNYNQYRNDGYNHDQNGRYHRHDSRDRHGYDSHSKRAKYDREERYRDHRRVDDDSRRNIDSRDGNARDSGGYEHSDVARRRTGENGQGSYDQKERPAPQSFSNDRIQPKAEKNDRDHGRHTHNPGSKVKIEDDLPTKSTDTQSIRADEYGHYGPATSVSVKKEEDNLVTSESRGYHVDRPQVKPPRGYEVKKEPPSGGGRGYDVEGLNNRGYKVENERNVQNDQRHRKHYGGRRHQRY